MEQLNLTTDWDKVFPKSDKVDHSKVTFHNRYGITLAADLYIPKGSKQADCLPLRYADRSVRSRSSRRVCMPRPWRSLAS